MKILLLYIQSKLLIRDVLMLAVIFNGEKDTAALFYRVGMTPTSA